MNSALGGRLSGGRALQPPPPPRSKTPSGGVFPSLPAAGLGFLSVQTVGGTQPGCHPGVRCDNFLEV